MKDDLARKREEELQRTVQAHADKQRRLERLTTLPDFQLTAVEVAERDTIRAKAKLDDSMRNLADGTHAREFQANLDRHCAGRAIEELRVGLTLDQVLSCTIYQNPADVDTVTTAAGTVKRYRFEGHGKPTFLYFQGDVLTGISR